MGNSKDVTLWTSHMVKIEVGNIIDKINSYFGYSFVKNIKIKIIETKYTKSKEYHFRKIIKILTII